ncbi:MAG: DoxX family membrane protein [Alphaproteobacteria bacterium]|nr:DoxX family membrane protein [Alphaproteobacteria bacterium]
MNKTLWKRATDLLGLLPQSVILLMARVGVASVFLKSGLLKVQSWDVAVQLFRDEYRVPILPPEIAAQMAATFELSCSALLIAGLATRLATLPLLGMIVVIQTFVYPDAWTDHLMWSSLLILILTRGPGALSVDHLLGSLVSNARRAPQAS